MKYKSLGHKSEEGNASSRGKYGSKKHRAPADKDHDTYGVPVPMKISERDYIRPNTHAQVGSISAESMRASAKKTHRSFKKKYDAA